MTASRDNNGRFVRGNPGGPGNPHAGKIAKIRDATFSAVAPEDIKCIMRAMVTQAVEGNVQAAAFVLDRLCGKPQSSLALSAEVSMSGEVEHLMVPPGLPDDPLALELMDATGELFFGQLAGRPTAVTSVEIDAIISKLQELKQRALDRQQTGLNGQGLRPNAIARTPIARLPESPDAQNR